MNHRSRVELKLWTAIRAPGQMTEVKSNLLEYFDRFVKFGSSKEVGVAMVLRDGRPGLGNGVEGRFEIPA